jgi:hypothetical protein
VTKLAVASCAKRLLADISGVAVRDSAVACPAIATDNS